MGLLVESTKVMIYPSPSADSRTTDGPVAFEDMMKSTDMHINDVNNVLQVLAEEINKRGEEHDWTKKSKPQEFYSQFIKSIGQDGSSFKESDWYKYHITTERHHLNSHIPEDVNLIDVLEMIVDCICAGAARSGGNIRPVELSTEVLEKAFHNTEEYVKSLIQIEHD